MGGPQRRAHLTELACHTSPDMDPDILAMVGARPEEGDGNRRRGVAPEVLEKARAQSAANRKSRTEASMAVSDEGVRLAALCIPGVASLVKLGARPRSTDDLTNSM